ncbi:MAG TPA: hypothetical protein VGY98_18655, partial [Verrucomicrobiae bacterium]|nr:hypothetical protein [Verrucomicrobiae bacterium]
KQLGAMLPDETLRHDVNLFTTLNRWMLALWLILIFSAILLPQFSLSQPALQIQVWAGRAELAALLFLGLAPLSITMALIWKTKEVILDSVFGGK